MRPVRVVAVIGVAVGLWWLFGCADPTGPRPNIHPAPLVEHDSTTVEAP